jgi:hypothetical protein
MHPDPAPPPAGPPESREISPRMWVATNLMAALIQCNGCGMESRKWPVAAVRMADRLMANLRIPPSE